LKIVKGNPQNIGNPLICRVSKKKSWIGSKNTVLVTRENPKLLWGYSGVITTKSVNVTKPSVSEISDSDFDTLFDGDIVKINSDGMIQVLWENKSHQNVFFMTDYCNSACIMCPQKSVSLSRSYHELNQKILSLLSSSDEVKHICFTGGEPTLCLDNLVELLHGCKTKFPSTPVSLLTNGKLLSDFSIAKKIVEANSNIMFCIPLYAPTDIEHDLIVGSEGSFQQTIKGLYNLARLKAPVEIRVVMIKQNYDRLVDLAEFIFRNMPFVAHIALMGMECSGVASKNLNDVWVDPIEYQAQLRQCVIELHRRAMNVSIFNLPYCLLPKEMWRFSRDSISEWKKTFQDSCTSCIKIDHCAGNFATSTRQSRYLKPIIE